MDNKKLHNIIQRYNLSTQTSEISHSDVCIVVFGRDLFFPPEVIHFKAEEHKTNVLNIINNIAFNIV